MSFLFGKNKTQKENENELQNEPLCVLRLVQQRVRGAEGGSGRQVVVPLMQVVGDEDGWRQLPSIRDVQCEPGMDEERALLRTAELVEREGHIVPAGWPRDVIRCAVCDEMHPRELCCQSETSARGETHCGELELITWNMDDDNYRVDLDIDNADSAAARALESCGRDHGRLFDERPDAFRWTCCGARGSETSYGCHHHHHVYWRREGSTCKCEECRKDRPKKSMNMYCEDTFRFGIALETRMLTGVGFFSKNIWNSIEGMRWAYTHKHKHTRICTAQAQFGGHAHAHTQAHLLMETSPSRAPAIGNAHAGGHAELTGISRQPSKRRSRRSCSSVPLIEGRR